jgi:hypothetical protein
MTLRVRRAAQLTAEAVPSTRAVQEAQGPFPKAGLVKVARFKVVRAGQAAT